MLSKSLWATCLAELVGTAFLIFGECGCLVRLRHNGPTRLTSRDYGWSLDWPGSKQHQQPCDGFVWYHHWAQYVALIAVTVVTRWQLTWLSLVVGLYLPIKALMNFSGGHINPNVTLMLKLSGRAPAELTWLRVVCKSLIL